MTKGVRKTNITRPIVALRVTHGFISLNISVLLIPTPCAIPYFRRTSLHTVMSFMQSRGMNGSVRRGILIVTTGKADRSSYSDRAVGGVNLTTGTTNTSLRRVKSSVGNVYLPRGVFALKRTLHKCERRVIVLDHSIVHWNCLTRIASQLERPSNVAGVRARTLVLSARRGQPLCLRLASTLLGRVISRCRTSSGLPARVRLYSRCTMDEAAIQLTVDRLRHHKDVCQVRNGKSFITPGHIDRLGSLLSFSFTDRYSNISPSTVAGRFNNLASNHPVSMVVLRRFKYRDHSGVRHLRLACRLRNDFVNTSAFFVSGSHIPGGRLSFRTFDEVVSSLSGSVRSIERDCETHRLDSSRTDGCNITGLPIVRLARCTCSSKNGLVSVIYHAILAKQVPCRGFVFGSWYSFSFISVYGA